MLNRVVLVGRLTKEPELRYTQSGVAIARFSLAVNRNFTNAQGEREADFINIIAWRGLADTCANYLHKGSLVGVDGRLQTGSYENSEGKRIYTTDVVAENVQFLEPKGSRDGKRSSDDPLGADDDKPIVINDDDLPF